MKGWLICQPLGIYNSNPKPPTLLSISMSQHFYIHTTTACKPNLNPAYRKLDLFNLLYWHQWVLHPVMWNRGGAIATGAFSDLFAVASTDTNANGMRILIFPARLAFEKRQQHNVKEDTRMPWCRWVEWSWWVRTHPESSKGGLGNVGVGLKSASRTGGCRSTKDENGECALG